MYYFRYTEDTAQYYVNNAAKVLKFPDMSKILVFFMILQVRYTELYSILKHPI